MKTGRFTAFLKRHCIMIACVLAGCAGGGWGIFIGLLTGFFVETIIHRNEEIKYLAGILKKPSASAPIVEPFEGAALCAELTWFCAGSEYAAADALSRTFPEYSAVNWELLCRAAGSIEMINADLVAECLAAALRKSKDTELPERIFRLLSAVEFGWRDERGTRPSEYIMSLLSYTPVTTEYEKACMLLGISVRADMNEIKKAWRKMAALYHPDTTGALSPEQQKVAEDMFRRVQEAYDLICGQYEA